MDWRLFLHSFLLLFLLLFFITTNSINQAQAQYDTENGPGAEVDEDDLNVGGDIFSDYNEDIEASQVVEDERFYRYGRFYSLNISGGMTTFTGNRGSAYQDKHPTLGLSLVYFMNFQMAFGIGGGYSKHYMILNEPTKGFNYGAGLIEINMFRSFIFYRYYFDTADLGTAITYANPYVTARLEFWNQTKKYIDQIDYANDSNGAVGASAGAGMEFPVKIRESYVGVEGLYHVVNFRDAYTQLYRPIEGGSGGYNDLTGNIMSVMISYVVSW